MKYAEVLANAMAVLGQNGISVKVCKSINPLCTEDIWYADIKEPVVMEFYKEGRAVTLERHGDTNLTFVTGDISYRNTFAKEGDIVKFLTGCNIHSDEELRTALDDQILNSSLCCWFSLCDESGECTDIVYSSITEALEDTEAIIEMLNLREDRTAIEEVEDKIYEALDCASQDICLTNNAKAAYEALRNCYRQLRELGYETGRP